MAKLRHNKILRATRILSVSLANKQIHVVIVFRFFFVLGSSAIVAPPIEFVAIQTRTIIADFGIFINITTFTNRAYGAELLIRLGQTRVTSVIS